MTVPGRKIDNDKHICIRVSFTAIKAVVDNPQTDEDFPITAGVGRLKGSVHGTA